MSSLVLPPVKPQHYRPDIDGLRAVAIVSVVLFHSFPNWLPGGFVGVDVFFVISGYLISTIIFRSFDKGTFSFSDFYARRVRRIFPALSFLLIGVMILGALTLTPEEFKDLGKQVIYGSAFGENIYLIRHSGGYWDTATEMMPLMHLWTLAVEEQYYIFYPLLCWALWKWKRMVLPALCFLWCLSFGLDIYQSQSSSVLAFFSLHTRFWELCTGCILAALIAPNLAYQKTIKNIGARLADMLGVSNQSVFLAKLKEAVSWLGLFLILAGVAFANGEEKLRSLLILLPVIGTVLIILSKGAWLNKKILSSGPFVFIGLISYTWYLWHWPLLSIARNIEGGELPGYGICLLLLLAGFLLSVFSYFIIETPVRRKVISKKLTTSLSMCILFCAMFGTLILVSKGIPSRLGEAAVASRSVSNTFPGRDKFAMDKYGCPKNLDFCWTTPNSQPTIALVGDSHAHHLAFGLQKNMNKPFLLIGHGGTLPVRDLISLRYEKASKSPLMGKALNIVNNDLNIKTVILGARWQAFVNAKKGSYELLGYKNDNNLITLEHLLTRTIQELIKNNKKVILLLDVPQLPINPKNCLRSRPFQKGPGVCDFPKEKIKTSDDQINEMIRKVAKDHPSVVVVDLSKAICHEGRCTIGDGKTIYYRDDNHLTDIGSELVAKRILQELKEGLNSTQEN